MAGEGHMAKGRGVRDDVHANVSHRLWMVCVSVCVCLCVAQSHTNREDAQGERAWSRSRTAFSYLIANSSLIQKLLPHR